MPQWSARADRRRRSPAAAAGATGRHGHRRRRAGRGRRHRRRPRAWARRCSSCSPRPACSRRRAVWVVGVAGRPARPARRAAPRGRRDVAAFGAAVERSGLDRRRHHDATTPDVAAAVEAARTLRGDLWCRRSGHPDLHRVTLGCGSVELDVELDAAGREPLAPELAAVVADRRPARRRDRAGRPRPGRRAGDRRSARRRRRPLARRAARRLERARPTSQLVVVAGDPAAWDWCRWLPHAAGPDGPRVVAADDADRLAAVLGALDDGAGRHVVVVTDRADVAEPADRRRCAGSSASAPSAAVLAVVGPDGSTPAMCRSVLEVGSIGRGRWWADASADGHPVPVHVAGVTDADGDGGGSGARRARRPGGSGVVGPGAGRRHGRAVGRAARAGADRRPDRHRRRLARRR